MNAFHFPYRLRADDNCPLARRVAVWLSCLRLSAAAFPDHDDGDDTPFLAYAAISRGVQYAVPEYAGLCCARYPSCLSALACPYPSERACLIWAVTAACCGRDSANVVRM